MKQSEAKEFLPIIKAWSEGKTLEFNFGTSNSPLWRQVYDVEFNKPSSFYRIERGLFLLIINDSSAHVSFDNLADAEEFRKNYFPSGTVIKCK